MDGVEQFLLEPLFVLVVREFDEVHAGVDGGEVVHALGGFAYAEFWFELFESKGGWAAA